MGFVPKYSLVFSSINMLYLIPTIDFDLSLVKDNAAYGVSLLILQINQVFSITENYGANLTVLGQSRTNYSPPPGTLGVTMASRSASRFSASRSPLTEHSPLSVFGDSCCQVEWQIQECVGFAGDRGDFFDG